MISNLKLDSICSILIYRLAFLFKHRKMSIYEQCSLGNQWNFSEKLIVTYAFKQRVLSHIRNYKLRKEIYQVGRGGVC